MDRAPLALAGREGPEGRTEDLKTSGTRGTACGECSGARWGCRPQAAAHGIDARSLNASHQDFRRREPKPVQLVEVVAPSTQPEARHALIVGETRLEFGDDCSEVALRRVLQALRPC